MSAPVLLSISDQVYRVLMDKILGGELPPGTRLLEAKLSEEFNTSRLPIREALQRLVSDGLVDTAPRRGAAVANLDARKAVEVIDALNALLVLAARQAAQKVSDADLTEMEESLNEVRKEVASGRCKGYPHSLYDMDEHIVRISGNGTIGEILRGLSMKIALVRTYSPSRYSGPLLLDIFDEHWDIYQALRARDEERAAEAVTRHLMGVKGRLVARLT